jgi:hypothetical protein
MSAAELQQMQRDGVFHGSPADIERTLDGVVTCLAQNVAAMTASLAIIKM